ncbi:hypothetical protein F5Y17DRAFT_447764, partial [Xylariaceae sp. FL0594]
MRITSRIYNLLGCLTVCIHSATVLPAYIEFLTGSQAEITLGRPELYSIQNTFQGSRDQQQECQYPSLITATHSLPSYLQSRDMYGSIYYPFLKFDALLPCPGLNTEEILASYTLSPDCTTSKQSPITT